MMTPPHIPTKMLSMKLFRSPLFWILLVVVAEWIVHFSLWSTPCLEHHGADPRSYVKASHTIGNVLSGDVDIQRTPVYPAFIAFCRLIAGEKNALVLTVIGQRIISILALLPLYYICRFFFKTKFLPAVATSFYAALIIGSGYLSGRGDRFDTWIMTESLSMSLSIFFFYFLIGYAQKATYLKAIMIGLTVFVLAMLRPAFLVFLPIVFLYWLGQLVFFRGQWKQDVAGLLTVCLSVLLLFGYSHLVYLKCGIAHISVIAVYNQFMCVIQSGITQHGADTKINNRIQECLENFKKEYPEKIKNPNWMFDREVDALDSPLGYVRRTYPFSSLAGSNIDKVIQNKDEPIPMKMMQDYTSATLKMNKMAYARYVIKKCFWVAFSEIRVGAIYVVLAINAVLWLPLSIRQDKIGSWLHLIGMMLTFTMIFASMAASFSSYGRIILPVLPLAIVLGFMIMDKIWLVAIPRR
ncbi:MAG: hypothetical protein LBU65_14420 [Planctomycetaceae bacterium]|jgi:hypothetical protein|nr:hypothetical protein [Planctomycetaceae bacterium]